MVKEVENIDSSACQASTLEQPVGGGWVGVASFVYLFMYCFSFFFPKTFNTRRVLLHPEKTFSLFIFSFSARPAGRASPELKLNYEPAKRRKHLLQESI